MSLTFRHVENALWHLGESEPYVRLTYERQYRALKHIRAYLLGKTKKMPDVSFQILSDLPEEYFY